MFFEEEGLSPVLLNVLSFNGPVSRAARNTLQHHAALSIRLESDTTITINGTAHRLTGENVSYFPPDTPYTRESRNDRMIVFHFSLPATPAEFVSITPGEFGRMAELAQEAYRSFWGREPGGRYRASACFYTLLALLREGSAAHGVPDPTGVAVRYIARRLQDPTLTVREVAEAAYVSEVYLRTLFRRRFGCSPKAYLTRERVAYACTLLESGFYTVEECAGRSGFADPKNFATVIKQQTGRSPSAWRHGKG